MKITKISEVYEKERRDYRRQGDALRKQVADTKLTIERKRLSGRLLEAQKLSEELELLLQLEMEHHDKWRARQRTLLVSEAEKADELLPFLHAEVDKADKTVLDALNNLAAACTARAEAQQRWSDVQSRISETTRKYDLENKLAPEPAGSLPWRGVLQHAAPAELAGETMKAVCERYLQLTRGHGPLAMEQFKG